MTELDEVALADAATKTLYTPRTVLKPPSLEQVATRQAWAQANYDPLVFVSWWRKSTDPDTATRSAQSEIEWIRRGEGFVYNVFKRVEGVDPDSCYACGPYVGRIDMHSWDLSTPRCEIGYMADVRTQGRGLLREAAQATLNYAFELGVKRVQAITDPRNTASVRFALALGMQQEGVLRNYERDHAGQLCDQVVFAIVRG